MDDAERDRKHILEFVKQYQKENNISIQTDLFSSGFEFLERFKANYDIVFLDIEMPGLDGIETAREIRRTDDTAGIIFITNMAQYAIKGYEVNAIDFMVKPVNYYNFEDKLKRAIQFSSNRSRKYIIVKYDDGVIRMPLSDLFYVIKERNNLVYHTRRGEFRERRTMQWFREKYGSACFAECMTGCMVNMTHIEKIGKDTVLVAGSELPVSRRLKKEFIKNYMDYVGGVA